MDEAALVFRKLNRLAGRAVHRFGLIQPHSRILVGLSGGKDSLTLLYWLAKKRGRIPVSYQLGAAHLHPAGLDSRLEGWLRGLELDFLHLEPAPPLPPAAAGDKPGGRCYLCALARRKRLFDLAGEYQAPLLALGHHQNDAVETFLMNIIYSGETSAMLPRQRLFGGRLHLIRPLFLTPESVTRRMAETHGFPVTPAVCGVCGQTSRQRVKELVAALARENPQTPGNIFHALFNVRLDYMPRPAENVIKLEVSRRETERSDRW